MTAPVLPNGHFSNDLLIRLIDDELPGLETATAEDHLAECSSCRDRYLELRRASSSFDAFVDSLRPSWTPSEREALAHKLDLVEAKRAPVSVVRPAQRLGWGVAIAAALTLGVFSLTLGKKGSLATNEGPAVTQSAGAFEIDGETFVALPFSNPELPLTSPRIVQMQVPVSSLAEAGVLFEPISSRISTSDRSVLADVLLGLDGQPLAVHVLSLD